MSDVLKNLSEILADRKRANPKSSYVASLHAKGTDHILKKIGEEATEVVLAGKSSDQKALVHEIADLWFHTLVLLSHKDLSADDILAELERRYATSGIEEKNSRVE